MNDLPTGAAQLWFDGRTVDTKGGAGRRLVIDARCLQGRAFEGAHVHVCAPAGPDAAIEFDQPEVQQARRDALASWTPVLGSNLLFLTTLALDESRYGTAITVTRRPAHWSEDPFARLFPGTVVRSDLFCDVAPPSDPVIERQAGVPWPGGRFS